MLFIISVAYIYKYKWYCNDKKFNIEGQILRFLRKLITKTTSYLYFLSHLNIIFIQFYEVILGNKWREI